MASEVEICNDALFQLGSDEILISLGDETLAGRACATMYPICRDQVMTRFAWNSCKHLAQLAPMTEEPAWGYAYKYQLPTDCLRVIRIGVDSIGMLGREGAVVGTSTFDAYRGIQPARWARHGTKIVAEVKPLFIEYIRKVTDPNEYDPALKDAISAYLAYKIAYQITGSRLKQREMQQHFLMTIDEAMATNSLEGSTEQLIANQTLLVR